MAHGWQGRRKPHFNAELRLNEATHSRAENHRFVCVTWLPGLVFGSITSWTGEVVFTRAHPIRVSRLNIFSHKYTHVLKESAYNMRIAGV